ITTPPPGTHLVDAEEHDGVQITRYWHNTHDPDDAPLTLSADPKPPFPAPPPGGLTVHGVPAAFAPLTDDGDVYGRAIRWIEPSGIGLSLELDGEPQDAQLQQLAESVQQVPPERWDALKTAFSDAPERPTPDM